MEFRVLGSLAAMADGVAAELGPRKQRAVLAVLLLHPGQIVPVERLVSLLWGEDAPRTAPHSIEIYVSGLRRALEPLGASSLILTRPPGYLLDAERASIDAWRFEDLVREGARLLESGDSEAGRARLRGALTLWQGPALADFAYEEFAQPHIRRLNDTHLDAFELLAAAELAAGRPGAVVTLLSAAVQEDPLRERSRELLMLALYRSGRHADALRTFDALRMQLADELGIDPSPRIRALYDRILMHDPSLLPELEPAAARDAARDPDQGLRPRVSLVAFGAGKGGEQLGVEWGFDRAVSDFGLAGRKFAADEVVSREELSRIIGEASQDDPALVVVFFLSQIADAAREHPDTQFLVFDYVGAEPNVSYVYFREWEASFLAGAAAALRSKTGTVGFIGGWNAIGIWSFLAGYEAGARAADPGVTILSAWSGEWPDASGFGATDTANALARRMFADGADVVFGAAGPAGVGIVQAAAEMSSVERQLWVIGVDTDWYEAQSPLGYYVPPAWRNHILTSVLKRFDVAVYEALEGTAAGRRPPAVRVYGLDSGLVDIAYSGGFLDEIRPVLEGLRQQVITGEIAVPCIPDDADVAARVAEECGSILEEWIALDCPPWRSAAPLE
jgi:basic membrane lipoprotein Med (substrate-binding protein (PBP1-ABC) superfamily)/DNA-binding SARP family transcriptional activator